ncbi:MAG: HlyD family efflux transporter periplasmic adaptor subunit [Zoogloea sp.]|nr:HlyD family efflux transporter periplasmic adaptor subunit [Zoogloea sp.]
MHRLFGPRHAAFKLGSLAGLAVLLFALFATGDFRISGDATLEGRVRRLIVAPFDGFVASAQARAGQVVKEGDTLATLDDRELQLEASRWSSQQNQYNQQANDAEAQRNLAQIQIARAQSQQAEAQRRLSESMMAKAQVRAPFAGLIVSGDLSQQLGGAVRKGQSLFEIAPLDAYRIVLQVAESDIAHLRLGQRGELVLTALPDQTIPFKVTLITAVAHAEGGRNLFRVEAAPEAEVPNLRPGMAGIGKVSVGEERLVWIWSRRFIEWSRLQLWSWLGV